MIEPGRDARGTLGKPGAHQTAHVREFLAMTDSGIAALDSMTSWNGLVEKRAPTRALGASR